MNRSRVLSIAAGAAIGAVVWIILQRWWDGRPVTPEPLRRAGM